MSSNIGVAEKLLPSTMANQCEICTDILRDFTFNKIEDPRHLIIPREILHKAKGILILRVAKFGFLIEILGGHGVFMSQLSPGNWSGPIMVATGGLGGGLMVGAEVTDHVVCFYNEGSVKQFSSKGQVTLGVEGSLAVGPWGRTGEGVGSTDLSTGGTFAFAYSKSKGLYGGVSIDGTAIFIRNRPTIAAYGDKYLNAGQVLSGEIPAPPEAAGLRDILAHMYMEETPSGALSEKIENAAPCYCEIDKPTISYSDENKPKGLDASTPPQKVGVAKFELNIAHDHPQELTLHVGDYVEIFADQQSDVWWYGRVQGTETYGYFPRDWVDIVPPATNSSK